MKISGINWSIHSYVRVPPEIVNWIYGIFDKKNNNFIIKSDNI